MTAKEYLGQIKALISSLKSLLRQVQSLDDALTGASPLLSNMPSSPAPDVRRMERMLASKVDLERKIEVQSTELSEIINAINSLPNHIHSAILTARYVSGMEWCDIADDLRMSKSYVFTHHRTALEEIEKIF
jgi:DNA-directed RNA polymerase specialized sigma subunit